MVVKRVIHLQADSKPLNELASGTAITAATKIFSTDIVPIDLDDGEVGRIRIWITVEAPAKISYTIGSDAIGFYKEVNQGVALAANAQFAFDARVVNGSAFNIRSDTTTTCECFVDEVNRE